MRESKKLYECYLFDLDGTLVDTVDLICACYAHLLTVCSSGTCCDIENGVALDAEARQKAVRAYIISRQGAPLIESIQSLFTSCNKEQCQALKNEYVSWQKQHYKEYISLFPGVVEVLKRIRLVWNENGIIDGKLGIVTGRTRESTYEYLRMFGLEALVDIVVTPEDTTHHKPHPEPILTAMKMTCYIGDARFDIECATSAGVDSYLVKWSMDLDNLSALCTGVISDFDDFVRSS